MTPELTADSPGEASKQIPSTAGMTTKVVKGSMWTLAGQVAPLAVSLVTTPFVIRMLGAESYGVLILVGLIPTYLGFADFGMSLASTKFASEAYAEGDSGKEARIVRTAALISLCSSLPIATALFAFSGSFVGLFNVPENLHSEASLALKLAAVTFVLNFLNGIFNTPQLTRLRMDLNTLVNAGFRIPGLILSPVAIYLGYGVPGAVGVLLGASALTFVGHLITSGRLDRHLFGVSIESALIPSMLRFGGAWLVAMVAAMLLVNLEKLALPKLVSVTSLAHYSVAFTLANMATMFSSAMLTSLLPAFSQMSSPDKFPEFQALFSRGIRINLLWLIPSLILLAVVAEPFFTLWAGEEFGESSTLPFYVLLIGLFFNVLAYIPHSALTAKGRTDVFAKLYWTELIVYGIAVYLLITNFGIIGAAAAWSGRVVLDAAAVILISKNILGVSLHFAQYTRKLLPGVIALSPPFLWVILFEHFSFWLVALTVMSVSVYFWLAWVRFMHSDEKGWMRMNVVGVLGLFGSDVKNLRRL